MICIYWILMLGTIGYFYCFKIYLLVNSKMHSNPYLNYYYYLH